ncbi:MAG: hypothetical protein H0T46_19785 [Deltaproteobacteria bacterium]|nr:hypothetical protein [Deltaproteobacteria bacterium]
MIRFSLLLLSLLACSDGDRSAKAQATAEQPRQRRVIEPPVGVVRALPPHAIRATGVGPYKLGEKLSDLLDQLPSGPRVALFEVPGLLHRSLVRAEDDAVLIGGEPQSTATFVAVVSGEVARTETGIHVGSKREQLGPVFTALDRAHDPRLVIPAALKNARIVVDGGRVSSITILAEPTPAPGPATTAGDCVRPASTEKAIGSCLTMTGELIEVGENEITMRAPGSEKVIGPFRVTNVQFAVPLRMADGRDELVVVTRTDEPQLRSWSLIAFRIEAGKLVKSIDLTPLYQVSSSNARWIGAEVSEVDLYLELWNNADAIEVGGLLTTRPSGGATRDVVVISTVSVAHKRGKPATTDAGSAETPDAGAPVRDSSASGSAEPAKP